jgi:hypothetical protein
MFHIISKCGLFSASSHANHYQFYCTTQLTNPSIDYIHKLLQIDKNPQNQRFFPLLSVCQPALKYRIQFFEKFPWITSWLDKDDHINLLFNEIDQGGDQEKILQSFLYRYRLTIKENNITISLISELWIPVLFLKKIAFSNNDKLNQVFGLFPRPLSANHPLKIKFSDAFDHCIFNTFNHHYPFQLNSITPDEDNLDNSDYDEYTKRKNHIIKYFVPYYKNQPAEFEAFITLHSHYHKLFSSDECTINLLSHKKLTWTQELNSYQMTFNHNEDDLHDFIRTTLVIFYKHIVLSFFVRHAFRQEGMDYLSTDEYLNSTHYPIEPHKFKSWVTQKINLTKLLNLCLLWSENKFQTKLKTIRAQSMSHEKWFALSDPVTTPDKKIKIFCLTSFEALHEEGIKMQHCAVIHSPACMHGMTHMLSLRDSEDNRLSTASLNLSEKKLLTIKEHRGFRNTNPSREAVEALNWYVEQMNTNQLNHAIDKILQSNLNNIKNEEADHVQRLFWFMGYNPLDDNSYHAMTDFYQHLFFPNSKQTLDELLQELGCPLDYFQTHENRLKLRL